MSLQDGFKILKLNILDGGGGWGVSQTGKLTMRSPGSHSISTGGGFEGYWSSSAATVITGTNIISNGKNYSSGSWDFAGHGKAIVGEFVSVGIRGSGSGSLILPVIGQDKSMSFSDINVERGLAYNTANSDIHDLYQDFSSIAGSVHTDVTGKPNFDWFQGGPLSASSAGNYQSHPIRLDEFYGSNYSQYGGVGCLALGTKITMGDGTTKNIEDINVGDTVLSANVPGMPLDFDEEDTWSGWSGVPHGNAPNSVWATAYYDIQELNRIDPQTAEVFDVYFDYFDNYYLINGTLKATYEHPFFVLRNGSYSFRTSVSLLPGDKLYTVDNQFETIESVLFVNESMETVNLNVEPLDVYFGGGYLMHNVHGK
jgi:hypothetical protein